MAIMNSIGDVSLYLRRVQECRAYEEAHGMNDVECSDSTNSVVLSRLWHIPEQKASAMGPSGLLEYWNRLLDDYHTISFEVVGLGGYVG